MLVMSFSTFGLSIINNFYIIAIYIRWHVCINTSIDTWVKFTRIFSYIYISRWILCPSTYMWVLSQCLIIHIQYLNSSIIFSSIFLIKIYFWTTSCVYVIPMVYKLHFTNNSNNIYPSISICCFLSISIRSPIQCASTVNRHMQILKIRYTIPDNFIITLMYKSCPKNFIFIKESHIREIIIDVTTKKHFIEQWIVSNIRPIVQTYSYNNIFPVVVNSRNGYILIIVITIWNCDFQQTIDRAAKHFF